MRMPPIISANRPSNEAAQRHPELNDWRRVQADHQRHMAKLATAFAAAHEGDLPYCKTEGEQLYLTKRARCFRRDAERHLAKAQQLQATP